MNLYIFVSKWIGTIPLRLGKAQVCRKSRWCTEGCLGLRRLIACGAPAKAQGACPFQGPRTQIGLAKKAGEDRWNLKLFLTLNGINSRKRLSLVCNPFGTISVHWKKKYFSIFTTFFFCFLKINRVRAEGPMINFEGFCPLAASFAGPSYYLKVVPTIYKKYWL